MFDLNIREILIDFASPLFHPEFIQHLRLCQLYSSLVLVSSHYTLLCFYRVLFVCCYRKSKSKKDQFFMFVVITATLLQHSHIAF